jgi:2-polyprenyl-3-methyl-5-hydroxy-6-metoxy-1,4-benzoquinol methylase
MTELDEQKIIQSWQINAGAWMRAVRDERIESRKLVTNQAIVDTVMCYHPATVLDVGCGEGWLARKLAAQGAQAVGVDVVPSLIESARQLGGGDFQVCSYEELAADRLRRQFDGIVCNFSLLGNESVANLFRAIPILLQNGGHLFIQTLHPHTACGDAPYCDGWRSGSWAGFGPEFSDLAPWYFRTVASWVKLFVDSGLVLVELLEPLHPESNKPASIIFVGAKPKIE